MTDSSMEEMVDAGGAMVSLTDLAGLDMDDIEAQRGSVFPGGMFNFKVTDAKLVVFGSGEDKKGGIQYEFTCTNVHAFSNQDESQSEALTVGRKLLESIVIAGKDIDPKRQLGYAKAFMRDTGFSGTGTLQDLLGGFTGHEFKAITKIRADKNDPDKKYSGLGLNVGWWKVAPMDGALALKS